MKLLVSLLIIFAFILSSCSGSLEDQSAKLDAFVKGNRYGTSADVWLVKHNAFGENERVTLVFGFLDDFSFCAEIAELYMQKYPADQYRCQLAN